jgi:hypothetical protein
MNPAQAWLFWAAIVVITALVFWAGHHLGYRAGRVDEINDRLERPDVQLEESLSRIEAELKADTGYDVAKQHRTWAVRQYMRDRLDEFMEERKAHRAGDDA